MIYDMNMWLSIISLAGMSASVWGAYQLYVADRPTTAWISDLYRAVGEKPNYAVIAPNGYSPQAERESALNRARDVEKSIEKFSSQAKTAIGWVFTGFAIQAASQAIGVVVSGSHF